MYAVTISGIRSIGALVLAVDALAILVAGVAMWVVVAVDGSTTPALGFLLGGSASFGRLRFCFWF